MPFDDDKEIETEEVKEPKKRIMVQCVDCGLMFNLNNVEVIENDTEIEGLPVMKETLARCPRCNEFVRFRHVHHD